MRTTLLPLLASALLLVGCASGPLLVEAEPPVIVAPALKSAFAEPWKIPHGEWKPNGGVLRMTEIPARKHVPVLQHWVGLKTAVIELEFRQDATTTFYIGCDAEKHSNHSHDVTRCNHVADQVSTNILLLVYSSKNCKCNQ